MGMIDPALYWLIIGVILFFLELALPGFVLFFFAVAALLTALLSWLTPVALSWQLGFFIITSLGSLFALRGVIQRRFFTRAGKEDVDEKGEDVILAVPGDRGVVTTEITPPAEGRIKYSGTFWRAAADEKIEEGEIIEVVKQTDLVIHVRKV